MHRLGVFVAELAHFCPNEPVVLDVVDRFKQDDAHGRSRKKRHECLGSHEPKSEKHECLCRTKQRHKCWLQAPGGLPYAHNASKPKGIQHLAVARCRRIFRSCHIFVVAQVVVDKKLSIKRGDQQTLSKPLVGGVRTVAQFVGDVDG